MTDVEATNRKPEHGASGGKKPERDKAVVSRLSQILTAVGRLTGRMYDRHRRRVPVLPVLVVRYMDQLTDVSAEKFSLHLEEFEVTVLIVPTGVELEYFDKNGDGTLLAQRIGMIREPQEE